MARRPVHSPYYLRIYKYDVLSRWRIHGGYISLHEKKNGNKGVYAVIRFLIKKKKKPGALPRVYFDAPERVHFLVRNE